MFFVSFLMDLYQPPFYCFNNAMHGNNLRPAVFGPPYSCATCYAKDSPIPISLESLIEEGRCEIRIIFT